MRRIIWLGAFLLTTTSSMASPTDDSEANAPNTATISSDMTALEQAKSHLKNGDIRSAQTVLEKEKRAGTLTSEAAQLLYELSQHWLSNGYQLSLRSDQPDSVTQSTSTESSDPSGSEIASLYVDSVVYGFGTGLTWLAGVSRIEESALVILPSLTLAGGAAYTVYAMNKKGKLTRGMPRTISLGLRLGLVESILLTSYATPGNSRHVPIAIWSGPTVGVVLGALMANSQPISPARASMMESTALWGGALTALGHATVTNGEPSDHILLTSAIGVIGGATAGAYIGGSQVMTESRVRYLDLGGIAGALVTGGLYLSFAPSSAPPAIATGAVATGIVSGWLIAYRMTDADVPVAETTALNYRLLLSPNEMGGMQVTGFGTF